MLEDACVALQPSHVPNDLRYLVPCHAGHRLHAAEPPMVGCHSELDRAVKGDIGMVPRLIHTVHEWWSQISTSRR